MKVLVTGGAGFIGSHIVDAALEAGHSVAVVDNLWTGKRENVNPLARFYPLDIRDPELERVFEAERPEVVCHQAAQPKLPFSTRNPGYDAQVNVLGLIHVLENCARHGVRKVVHASSAAIYGSVRQTPITEATPANPVTPYGITKMAGEYYLRFWSDNHDLAYTALRYGNVYGPRQDPEGEAGVVAIFAGAMLKGQSVRVDWDGRQRKDYVYVGDVARANLLAFEHGDGEAYCIAAGQATSVNALYALLSEITGRSVQVVPGPKRVGDVPLIVFDCDKAERELGWRAEIGLKDGLQRTVASLEDRDG